MDSKLFVKDFTDLISQRYCFYCGKIEEVICAQCILLQVSKPKIHLVNNIPVLSMMEKDEVITRLIVAYKDQGVSTLKEPFARIFSFGLKYFSKHKYMKVVNVPSSVKAIQKRGLDPISLMTETACKMSGKRFYFDQNLLVNDKNRRDQATLNFKQRKINMQDAFKANYFEKKPVLVIDDLTTTGASLRSSIIALEKKMIKVQACVVLVSSD
jgi:predicted amidophosphoribosyltransferase